MKKNNAWNIRRLVDESFVPASQRTIVLYCRLTDFKIAWHSCDGTCHALMFSDVWENLVRLAALFYKVDLIYALPVSRT